MSFSKLRNLNFNKLLKIDFDKPEEYNFSIYQNNNYCHLPILGYCIDCEKKNLNYSNGSRLYKLTNISHASHSVDFINALNKKIDTSSWHNEPIMFVYESPSLNYDIYKKVSYKGFNKNPANKWYWIHNKKEGFQYPMKFKGGEYGDFILSAILTFKLKNVYVTNLIKCSLNNKNGNFLGIDYYNENTINNCYEMFLKKEVEFLNPKIIFAFGSKVESWLSYLFPNHKWIQQLPHPASRRRGFRNEYFKVLYFWLILNSLYHNKIVSERKVKELTKNFIKGFYEKTA